MIDDSPVKEPTTITTTSHTDATVTIEHYFSPTVKITSTYDVDKKSETIALDAKI